MLSSLLVTQDLVSASAPDRDRPPHVVAAIHRRALRCACCAALCLLRRAMPAVLLC